MFPNAHVYNDNVTTLSLDCNPFNFLDRGCENCSGPKYTHWHYRVPDESGELMKSLTSDFNAHGKEARKMRVLQQLDGIEELQNLKRAVERTDSHLIREDRSFDRVPVSSWSDPSGHVVLLGDGTSHFPPP